MALIKCFECGRQVSNSAVFCPHCGYNIAKHLRDTMPSSLPQNLNIGSILKTLIIKYDDKTDAYLMCHTHGFSIAFEQSEKIEIIPFTHVIDFSMKYYTSFYCAIGLHVKKTPYLRLEYWDWNTERRAVLEIRVLNADSVYVDESSVYNNFLDEFRIALFKSKETLPDKTSVQISVSAHLTKIKESYDDSIRWGCICFALLVVLFCLAICSNGFITHNIFANTVIIILSICILALFIFILYTINCFIRKY